ncbi:MAG: glycosyltransferase family 2 protein [Niabella sp.]
MPFISICIPAYQRPQYLKRLLDSIRVQSFADFEVIITDDSPDDSVHQLFHEYADIPSLYYHKNPRPLGTPANWNAAIALAKGQWIKLMHDDDWFMDTGSLQQFADAAKKNDGAFIFSAFINKYENSGIEKIHFPEKFRLKQLKKHPGSILSKNIIGHPSTTLYPNDGKCLYDEKLKWLVDVEMYIRRLDSSRFVYIKKTLVALGMSDSQVTAQVKMAPEVEIPEHLYFLKKTGVHILKNIMAYDYFWRFIRNFNVTTPAYFKQYDKENTAPEIISRMINAQNKIPKPLLRTGVISKLLMLLHYLTNKKYIK